MPVFHPKPYNMDISGKLSKEERLPSLHVPIDKDWAGKRLKVGKKVKVTVSGKLVSLLLSDKKNSFGRNEAEIAINSVELPYDNEIEELAEVSEGTSSD